MIDPTNQDVQTTAFQAALQAALALLRSRARSEAEIEEALLAKGYDSGAVQTVVTHLRNRRILDDRRLIQGVVAARTGRKSVGTNRMREELQRRGLAGDAAEQALEDSSAGEMERMQEVLSSKFDPNEARSRARAGRFLVNRGFSEDGLDSALDRFFGARSEEAE